MFTDFNHSVLIWVKDVLAHFVILCCKESVLLLCNYLIYRPLQKQVFYPIKVGLLPPESYSITLKKLLYYREKDLPPKCPLNGVR